MQTGWSGMAYLCSTIGLQVISQLLFKARSVIFVARRSTGEDSISYLGLAMTDPFIWLAMACAFLGMITWLLALARLELSTAYPIVSITFPIVAILGISIWNEPVGLVKMMGIALMFIGLIVISFGTAQ